MDWMVTRIGKNYQYRHGEAQNPVAEVEENPKL
jgi:hypothetical protein